MSTGPMAMKKQWTPALRKPAVAGQARGGVERRRGGGLSLERPYSVIESFEQEMTWPTHIIYKTSLRLLLISMIHFPTSAKVTFCKHNQNWSFCFKPSIVSPCTAVGIQTPKSFQETALQKFQQNMSIWKENVSDFFFKQGFTYSDQRVKKNPSLD